MPEAAEVRLNVDFLNRTLTDQPIKDITLNSGRFLKKVPKLWHLIMLEFKSYPEVRVTEVHCKGKLIWGAIEFVPNVIKYFTCSLGMSGSWTDQDLKHNHLTFHLENGTQVHFNDPRRFGNIAFYNNKEDIDKILDNLGHDFFQKELIETHIKERLDKIKSNKQVCEVLLDQSIFCGVGNYIKSEVLYRTKIHPATLWKDLVPHQVQLLFHECWYIIQNAYKAGGASFKTFKNDKGKLAGKYQFNFQVYGKKELSDGYPVSRNTFNDGRTSFFDPRVQIIKQ